MIAEDHLSLADWRRRVAEIYRDVRHDPDPISAWDTWRARRLDLFRNHPQSPVPQAQRSSFAGTELFDYDPAYRVLGTVTDLEPVAYDIQTSGEPAITFTRFARVTFALRGSECSLELFWLEGYGGGIFLPFRDATNSGSTYGGGRYLLDSVKGADLGSQDGRLVLDFNFSYNPSCTYDARWACPLAPPGNRLDLRVEAGERYP